MTTYIEIPTKKREFTTPVSIVPRSETAVAYDISFDQILWDDGTDIFWDDGTRILWLAETSYPIELHVKKRNFTLIARA